MGTEMRDLPVAVPAEASCAFTADLPESQNCCTMHPYATPVDIDDAYKRLVKEYGFHSQPSWPDQEGEAYPSLYHGHRHEAVAGSAYDVAGIVAPRSDRRLGRGVWLSVSLSKGSSGQTMVNPAYCQVQAKAMQDQLAWHLAVQGSLRSTLPPR